MNTINAKTFQLKIFLVNNVVVVVFCKNSFEALMFFCMLEGFSLIDFERQRGYREKKEGNENL